MLGNCVHSCTGMKIVLPAHNLSCTIISGMYLTRPLLVKLKNLQLTSTSHLLNASTMNSSFFADVWNTGMDDAMMTGRGEDTIHNLTGSTCKHYSTSDTAIPQNIDGCQVELIQMPGHYWCQPPKIDMSDTLDLRMQTNQVCITELSITPLLTMPFPKGYPMIYPMNSNTRLSIWGTWA